MSSIGGPSGAVPPDKMQQYKAEFSQGLKLFEDSLNDYKKADEVHKKAKLKDVMNKALQVMNETAGQVLKEQGKALEEKLNGDYEAYISNESDEGYNQLSSDISALRDSNESFF